VHQVIYTHGGGRLGNQVLRFAHWMAWVLEQDGAVEVRDLAFWPYARLFEVWRRHPGCVFPPRPDRWDELARWRALLPEPVTHRLDWRMQRAVHALGRHRRGWQAVALDDAAGEMIDLGDPAFYRRVAASPGLTCAGWRIAGWARLAGHEQAVRSWLQPARDYLLPAQGFIGELRRRHGFIIGVHLRQGDYRAWQGGRFLFPGEQYLRWIRQALELYAGQDPGVVLVSDGPVEDLLNRGLPVYRTTGGHGIRDWTVLSLCDVIICPPSTFPATAAFVGGRSLWPVTRRDQVLDRTQVIKDGLLGAARHPEFSLAVK
jgi:hypothetical protein